MISQLCVGRPDLVAVHYVVVAVAHGARPQARQVGARTRLREPLAPGLLTAQDLWNVPGFLLRRSLGNQRRAAVLHADEVDPDVRSFRASNFLVVDKLLGRRGIPTAEFRWPVDAGVAGFIELALPARIVGAASRPIVSRRRIAMVRDIFLQPATQLAAKLFVRVGIA